METREIEYKGVKCLEIKNKKIKVLVALDFGIRIIYFSSINGENLLFEKTSDWNKENLDSFKFYGGHRIWHTPEDIVRTYQPDNAEIAYQILDDKVEFFQKEDEKTHISKILTLSLEGDKLFLNHEIENNGLWDIETAIWAITMMKKGGLEVIPQNSRDAGLLSNRNISLWSYSKMNDSRLYYGEKFITLNSNLSAMDNFKIGLNVERNAVAYFIDNSLFIKKFNFETEVEYPDNNCNFETYLGKDFTELESLSDIALIRSGEYIDYAEEWELIENVSCPQNNDEKSLEKILEKYIED